MIRDPVQFRLEGYIDAALTSYVDATDSWKAVPGVATTVVSICSGSSPRLISTRDNPWNSTSAPSARSLQACRASPIWGAARPTT